MILTGITALLYVLTFIYGLTFAHDAYSRYRKEKVFSVDKGGLMLVGLLLLFSAVLTGLSFDYPVLSTLMALASILLITRGGYRIAYHSQTKQTEV